MWEFSTSSSARAITNWVSSNPVLTLSTLEAAPDPTGQGSIPKTTLPFDANRKQPAIPSS